MIVEDGRLPNESDPALDGIDADRLLRQLLVGLSLLHTLFVKEHNAICDYLKGALPDLGRRAAVPHRAARQLGPDGEDPHRRVDARASSRRRR